MSSARACTVHAGWARLAEHPAACVVVLVLSRTMVSVTQTGQDGDRFVFDVRVVEGGGETRHEVTLAKKDHARLVRPGEGTEALVERCFAFLLAREPKESILSRFDVSVIARYFPEFEGHMLRS
jgi:hypothetical protein